MAEGTNLKVVVGLGNPGNPYHGTRHNVGFAVVDALAEAPSAGRFQSRFGAQVCELYENGRKVLLVKPETFMNLSGRCVRQVVDFYQVALEDLLVVCDDVNLPLLLSAAQRTTGANVLNVPSVLVNNNGAAIVMSTTEPASMALLGVGLLGLGAIARRKRSS